MKHVSVIVPCYNYSEYLPECMKSIRAQTFQDFELIFADDGSTDGSIDMALRFSPDKVIRFKEHRGAVAIKNSAVALSEGKFICIIDADDYINPTYLEKCFTALTGNTKAGAAYSDFFHCGLKNNAVCFRDWAPGSLREWNHVLGSAMFRKKAYDAVGGFDKRFEVAMEDYDLWMCMEEKGWQFVHIPEVLYNYRAHARNRSNDEAKVREATKILWTKHKMLDRLKEFKE